MILHLGKRVASTFYLLIIRKMQSSAKMHVKKVIGFWSAKNYRFFVDFYCNTRKTKHPIFPKFYDVMTRITKNVKVCQINNIKFYNQWLLLNRILPFLKIWLPFQVLNFYQSFLKDEILDLIHQLYYILIPTETITFNKHLFNI